MAVKESDWPGREAARQMITLYSQELNRARGERDFVARQCAELSRERDDALREARGRYHHLTSEQAGALRGAARQIGLHEERLRLGDVAVALSARVVGVLNGRALDSERADRAEAQLHSVRTACGSS